MERKKEISHNTMSTMCFNCECQLRPVGFIRVHGEQVILNVAASSLAPHPLNSGKGSGIASIIDIVRLEYADRAMLCNLLFVHYVYTNFT